MRRKQKNPQGTLREERRQEAGNNQQGQSKAVASAEGENGREKNSRMLEAILSKDNMTEAYEQVKANKGASGIDGMTVDELQPYLEDAWAFIKAEIVEGSYRPKAVKCVMIPKASGGKRMLGIPTVVDRLIQQAIAQELSRMYDEGFSEHSYGFRPNRSAHDAVKQAERYINEGRRYIVDIDLEKFFDNVNHDRLMSRLAEKVKDKRVLKLIRKYLKSGIMEDGQIRKREAGVPQGSPLSPILSNIVLDELDKELERRGHKFCRYADDCSIYTTSLRAGTRVLASIGKYIIGQLKLKVNTEKSSVKEPEAIKLLGFSFYRKEGVYRIRVARKSEKALKEKIRQITQRRKPTAIKERLEELREVMLGWINYFKIADCKYLVRDIDGWTRSRLRMCIWKSWKRIRTKIRMLVRLGYDKTKAIRFANTRKGHIRVAQSPILKQSLTNAYFKRIGYTDITSVYSSLC